MVLFVQCISEHMGKVITTSLLHLVHSTGITLPLTVNFMC